MSWRFLPLPRGTAKSVQGLLNSKYYFVFTAQVIEFFPYLGQNLTQLMSRQNMIDFFCLINNILNG